MYKLQRLQPQAWAPGQTLTFNHEPLQDQLGGQPLHVAEMIIRFKGEIDGKTSGADSNAMDYILGMMDMVPNEVCEGWHVDGRAMHHLDTLLTGREMTRAPVPPAPGNAVDIFWRLPVHACLNGAKAADYGDLIQPVRRFRHGSTTITNTAAAFGPAGIDAEVVSGTWHVMFLTEPVPDAYQVGAMPVYDLFVRPTGESCTWVSKGRLALLGFSGNTADYGTISIPDACWINGLEPNDLVGAHYASQFLGGGDEVLGGTTGSTLFFALLWTRPCGAKLWTLPKFERGNRTIEVPGSVADPHRIITCQVLTSGSAIKQLEVDVGRKAVGPKISIRNVGDLVRAGLIKDYLPRRIPIWARDRAGRLVRAARS